MLEIISSVLGSVFAGGATGLLGVAAQRYFDLKKAQADMALEKQRQDHEAVMRDKDAAIAAQEWAARTQVAKVEGEAKVETAAQEAFAASFAMEPTRYSEGAAYTRGQAWVLVALDLLRGVVRPGLTVYLCALTTMIYLQARELIAKEDLSVEQALALDGQIINTILYLTTTCVLWWFGTRNQQKPPKTA